MGTTWLCLPLRVFLSFFLALILTTFSYFAVGAAVPTLEWEWTSPTFGDSAYSTRSVATDGEGNVYVIVMNIHSVRKYDNDGTFINQTGSWGTGNGQFIFPSAVAVDTSGNIYIAEPSRIQKLNSAYEWQWTVGSSGSGDGQLNAPESITVDSSTGKLYVSDTKNKRVQVFSTSDGAFLGKFGTAGTGPGQFYNSTDGGPWGIAVDSTGNIYVADPRNNRVQKFDSSYNFVEEYKGQAGTFGTLLKPKGVAVDSSGVIYISDTDKHRIQRISPEGVYLNPFGSNGTENGQFNNPTSIAIDSSGNVIIADSANRRVQKFNPNGSLSQITGTNLLLDIILTSNNTNVESTSSYGVNSATAPLRILTSGGLSISDVTVDMTADRDWSSVVGSSDRTLGKSFVDNVTVAPGVSATHTLYVPIPSGRISNSVYICPHATSLSEVTAFCADGVNRGAGTYSELFGELQISQVNDLGDGVTYWKIAGMTGSGGLAELETYSGAGGGSSEDPYEITTCEELQEMRYEAGASYELLNNIDCSDTVNWNEGKGFIPIGSLSVPFTGSFEGNEYTISNLFIVGSNVYEDHVGLFGHTIDAVIQNVNVSNLDTTSQFNFGGLIGFMDGGSIDNCHVSGSLSQLDYDPLTWVGHTGGLVGYSVGGASIANSSADVDIVFGNDPYNTGGLVGWADENTLIENCSATGDVTVGVNAYSIGGLVGWLRGGSTINDSYSTGMITVRDDEDDSGYSYDIGGLVGLVGWNRDDSGGVSTGFINRSYSTGNINVVSEYDENTEVGGLVGGIYYYGTIADSYATGSIMGGGEDGNVGGLVGLVANSGGEATVIRSSYALGDLAVGEDGYATGGLVGSIVGDTARIESCYAEGDVNGGLYAFAVGGLLGSLEADSVNVYQSYSLGNVSAGVDSYAIGGFVGYIEGGTTIEESAAFGNVNANYYAGGFGGDFDSWSNIYIYDSFSRGSVTAVGAGSSYMGSFVGGVSSLGSGRIQRCYGTGNITATDSVGNINGFIGGGSAANVYYSYWDVESTGVATDSYATNGYTTVQMKDWLNFDTWSFGTKWVINPIVNSGYPVLVYLNVEGSSGELTQITTCSELQAMQDNLNGTFELANNIDCSDTVNWNEGSGFIPIGPAYLPFGGSLDGNGYTISNLFLSREEDYGGLFGFTRGAEIRDVNMENFQVKGRFYLGGLVAYLIDGTIENCHVSGELEVLNVGSNAGGIGGLIGEAAGTSHIIRSTADTDITSLDDVYTFSVGAFIGGIMDSTTIEDSSASGSITLGNGSYEIGGFVGWAMDDVVIRDSTVDVDIQLGGDDDEIGGFVGWVGGNAELEGITTTGNVYVDTRNSGISSSNIGGVVGYYDGGNISNSVSYGDVTALGECDYVGGVAGALYGAEISQSASYGDVIGYNYVGGFVGEYGYGGGILTDTFSRGDVIANSAGAYVGGYVGNAILSDDVLTNSYSTGTVTANEATDYLGGFVGYIEGTPISDSYWDTESSGILADTSATGYTTAQMKDSSNFEGWDFENIWSIDPTVNDGYPAFIYMSEEPIEENVAIVNLDASLTAHDNVSNLDVTVPAVAFKGVGRNIRLFYGSGITRKLVAKSTVDLTSSRDWVGVSAGVDVNAKKSFVHSLATAPGASETFTLYVPKAANDNRVRVCFGASSLSAVTQLCSSGATLTESNATVDILTFENQEYWAISNVSGTGGVSFEYVEDTDETPTPQVPRTPVTCLADVKECPDGSYVRRIAPSCLFAACPTTEEESESDEEEIEEEPVEEVPTGGDPVEETPSEGGDEESEGSFVKDSVLPLLTKVRDSVTNGYKTTVERIANADIDTPATKTVVVGSASAVFLTYLFNIFSAGKDSYLTTLQLISPVFAFTRLKKKSQNYGVVYDSITKEPISQAIIRITDTGGRLITTVVTDVYGIFDINLESGSYKFDVEANGYTFPSRTIQTSVDEPYRNVYLGGIIEHSSQNVLNISIPMDKVDSRFIEESAASAKNILGTAWNIVIALFFVLGLVTSVMAIINNPTTLAWVVLCVYILFVVIFVFIRIRNSKKFGYVRSTDGTLLSGLEIGLVEQEFDQLYAKRVTDNEGKYRFILPGGKYKLVVLNPEFKLVNMEKDIFEVKEGSVLVLKEDLIVRKV